MSIAPRNINYHSASTRALQVLTYFNEIGDNLGQSVNPSIRQS